MDSPSYAFSGSAGVGSGAPASSYQAPSGGSSSSNGMPGTYVSDAASGANMSALAAGVKSGNVAGSLDAQGNYVAPNQTSANLTAQGTVSGLTPPPTSAVTNPSTSPNGFLQMSNVNVICTSNIPYYSRDIWYGTVCRTPTAGAGV